MSAGRRRRLWVVFGVVAVLAIAVVVVVRAGRGFRSPEQVAADAAPPSASPIVVQAELRQLVEPVVLRGQVEPGPSVRVLPPSSAIGASNIVTEVLIEVGNKVWEGMVLIERSGEPMIAVALPFPLWRDIDGGAEGPDVAEIQRFLGRVGHTVPVTRRWDRATQRALEAFLAKCGYDAERGPAAAQAQLADAYATRDKARAAHDAAVAGGVGVEEAAAALSSAEAAVESAELVAGPTLPMRYVVQIDKPGRLVSKVLARVGLVLSDPESALVELDAEAPYVKATIAPSKVGLVSVGQEATITDEVAGVSTGATVTAVGSDIAVGATGMDIRLSFVGEPMAAGQSRTVRVELATAISTEAVLAVPVTAIYARPDGSLFVTILDGSFIDVTVRVGQVAGGWAAVSSESPLLAPGAAVVVGEHAADLNTNR